MNSYQPEQVLNGTFSEVYCNSNLLAEATALEAKVAIDYADINMVGSLTTGKKMSGYSGSGTLKGNKVTSYWLDLLSDSVKKGKTLTCEIISVLADPDAVNGGQERIKLTGVKFTELSLIDFEVKKNAETSMPFTFTSWEILDSISE